MAASPGAASRAAAGLPADPEDLLDAVIRSRHQDAHDPPSVRSGRNQLDADGGKNQHPASTLLRTHASKVMEALPSRVFMNGNSQAVRIPAEFRLSADRVQITRTPEGDLVIHPCPTKRGEAMLEVLSGFEEDFVAALVQQQDAKLPVQERETL